MRRTYSLGFLMSTMCAVACSPGSAARASDTPAEAQPADTVAARNAIDSVMARMVAAVNRQDMAGMAEGLAEDYISLEDPTRAPIRGRAAYRAFVDSLAAGGTFHEMTYEPDGLEAGGDVVVRYGRFRSKYVPKGSDTVRFAGNFVHVWRRQPDGSWKLAREISNSVTPLPAPSGSAKK